MTSASQFPEIADAMQRAAQSHRAGNLDEAERIYRDVLARASDHFAALHALSVITAQRSDFLRAHELLQRTLAINPNLADAQANQTNVQNALARHEDAMAIMPRFVHALTNCGAALHDLHLHDEALATFDRVLALKPDLPEALNNRGHSLQSLRRYDEARASYDKALAQRPHFAEALFNRGVVLSAIERAAYIGMCARQRRGESPGQLCDCAVR